MSTDPFDYNPRPPARTQLTGGNPDHSDALDDELFCSVMGMPLTKEHSKPVSLLFTGVKAELIEQIMADAGIFINPNSLNSICSSILESQQIDPALMNMCMLNISDYTCGQTRTFKSCRDKFIDYRCGVYFEYDGMRISIDKYFTSGRNNSLSVNVDFLKQDADDSWEFINNALLNYHGLNLDDELLIHSQDNTIWDGGHAQFLVTDDIFISTSPRSTDVVPEINPSPDFELQWVPEKIQFTGLTKEQLFSIAKTFHSAELKRLCKSGFVHKALESAQHGSIPSLSLLWPLANPLSNLTTLNIDKIMRVASSDPRREARVKLPFAEFSLHCFESDIGEIGISFRPFSEKAPCIIQVNSHMDDVYPEDQAVFEISWDPAGLSEEEVKCIWEIVDELAENFSVKKVKSKLEETISQYDMPELKQIDSEIGTNMRLSLRNSRYPGA